MKHRFPVIDGDGHIFENNDTMISCYEGPRANKKTKSAPIFPSIDGWPRRANNQFNDDNPNRPDHTDAAVWAAALEKFGLAASVLFPSAGLGIGLMRDRDFCTATAIAYNNWMETTFTSRDPRLFSAGLVPLMDPTAAVAEIKRCATVRKGFACMLLPTVTSSTLAYGEEFYWPIFEEAERQNMPIALHGGSSAGFGLDHFTAFYMVHALSQPVPIFKQLTSIILSGVFDAFPRLRMVFLEAGCSWVPFMMDRLDGEYGKIYSKALRNKVKRHPSEYIRDTGNFWVSLELEEQERSLKYTLDAIGPDRIIYGSDYPHETPDKSIAGSVTEFIDNPMYSDEVKEKILGKNAMKLYNITDHGIDRSAASA